MFSTTYLNKIIIKKSFEVIKLYDFFDLYYIKIYIKLINFFINEKLSFAYFLFVFY